MYRKDVNERSPMRVFEKSTHGGLGRGNVGVVASQAGVGKTPLLVQIALDDLLRDRRVLHISLEQAVDHVRAYYDEIFHDLAAVSKLADPDGVRLEVERHRLIYSHVIHAASSPPPSARGGRTSIRILETVNFARNVAHFEPEAIIIDGFDMEHAAPEALQALRDLARERNVELWISCTSESVPAPGGGLPRPLDRFESVLSVIVFLAPERDVIELRLLKDHGSSDLADLHLRLDPHTMRVIDQDVPPTSERAPNPKRFRLYSGGGCGAEAAFGACAERWGVNETHFSFVGHSLLERSRGVVVLGDEELRRAILAWSTCPNA